MDLKIPILFPSSNNYPNNMGGCSGKTTFSHFKWYLDVRSPHGCSILVNPNSVSLLRYMFGRFF